MWGPSYMGSVQWLTAVQVVLLAAAAPTASASTFYYNLYLGGAYMLAHAKTGFSIDLFGPPTNIGSSPEWSRWYMHLPLSEWDKVIGRSVPWQMGMMTHNRPDGFWKRSDASTEFGDMDFPAQHVVGYYDFMCRDSVKSFQAMQRSASARSRRNQQLIRGRSNPTSSITTATSGRRRVRRGAMLCRSATSTAARWVAVVIDDVGLGPAALEARLGAAGAAHPVVPAHARIARAGRRRRARRGTS